jgi:hypothetical protein
VWDGPDQWTEPSRTSTVLATLWRWLKWGTIVTALTVSAALLALNREKWVPQAQDAATVLGENVDRISERASTRRVPPEAIAAAREQIPSLRAETVETIMARRPGMEPAEVFRRAHQAAESARAGLPPRIGEEIDKLATAAAGHLDPAEGERLRDYLAVVRAGTPTAAYQDREAVWLMGRGTRRLSADELARLEELFAQVVASALQPSPAP